MRVADAMIAALFVLGATGVLSYGLAGRTNVYVTDLRVRDYPGAFQLTLWPSLVDREFEINNGKSTVRVLEMFSIEPSVAAPVQNATVRGRLRIAEGEQKPALRSTIRLSTYNMTWEAQVVKLEPHVGPIS
jgi:hypothetical protein